MAQSSRSPLAGLLDGPPPPDATLAEARWMATVVFWDAAEKMRSAVGGTDAARAWNAALRAVEAIVDTHRAKPKGAGIEGLDELDDGEAPPGVEPTAAPPGPRPPDTKKAMSCDGDVGGGEDASEHEGVVHKPLLEDHVFDGRTGQCKVCGLTMDEAPAFCAGEAA